MSSQAPPPTITVTSAPVAPASAPAPPAPAAAPATAPAPAPAPAPGPQAPAAAVAPAPTAAINVRPTPPPLPYFISGPLPATALPRPAFVHHPPTTQPGSNTVVTQQFNGGPNFGAYRQPPITQNQNPNSPVNCPECARTFSTYPQCRRHQMEVHRLGSRRVTRWSCWCDICHFHFSSHDDFDAHYRSSHPGQVYNNLQPELNEGRAGGNTR